MDEHRIDLDDNPTAPRGSRVTATALGPGARTGRRICPVAIVSALGALAVVATTVGAALAAVPAPDELAPGTIGTRGQNAVQTHGAITRATVLLQVTFVTDARWDELSGRLPVGQSRLGNSPSTLVPSTSPVGGATGSWGPGTHIRSRPRMGGGAGNPDLPTRSVLVSTQPERPIERN